MDAYYIMIEVHHFSDSFMDEMVLIQIVLQRNSSIIFLKGGKQD